MDWFEQLTGFREEAYAQTRAKLEVRGERLSSRENGRDYGIGRLELVSLGELRQRTAHIMRSGKIAVRNVSGDVRGMHGYPEYRGAIFQVASQFNLLEMTGPSVTPEDGVTRYASDRTQGPACAIAAGPATIYRNYFAPVGEQLGQTRERQLDGLSDMGAALAELTGRSVDQLWLMRNGYALCMADGLAAISSAINRMPENDRDHLRSRLRVGLHWDVEVTDGAPVAHTVSQVFCSALPVAYSGHAGANWRPFAMLVLEAAYEATLLAALLNAERGASRKVLLTRLGGGAFGNDDAWIDAAMVRALSSFKAFDLEVHLVSFGGPTASMLPLEDSLP